MYLLHAAGTISDFNDIAKLGILGLLRKFFCLFLPFFLPFCTKLANFVKENKRNYTYDATFLYRVPYGVGAERGG